MLQSVIQTIHTTFDNKALHKYLHEIFKLPWEKVGTEQ